MQQLFSLDGKTVAVIGAGSGIGAEVAAGCGRQGACVGCYDVDDAAVRELAARGWSAKPVRG